MGEQKLEIKLPAVLRPYVRDEDRQRFILYMTELGFVNQSDFQAFLLDVYEESQNRTELKNIIDISKGFRKALNQAKKSNPTIYKMLMSIVNEEEKDGSS